MDDGFSCLLLWEDCENSNILVNCTSKEEVLHMWKGKFAIEIWVVYLKFCFSIRNLD